MARHGRGAGRIMPDDKINGPQNNGNSEIERLSTSELLVAIMNRISNDIGDEALVRVLKLLDEIALEQRRSG